VLRLITNKVLFGKRNLHPLFWLGVIRGVCVWHPVSRRRSASKAGRQEGTKAVLTACPVLPAFLPSCEPKPNHPPLDGIHLISREEREGREGKRSPSLRPPFTLRSLREPARLWKVPRPNLEPRSSPSITFVGAIRVHAENAEGRRDSERPCLISFASAKFRAHSLSSQPCRVALSKTGSLPPRVSVRR
jgi:hypothetical protein